MSDGSAQPRAGSFRQVGAAFWERFRRPADQFIYWVYLFVGVVVFGGFGVALAYYDYLAKGMTADAWRAAGLALATYAPAVAGAAAVQVILDDAESPANRALVLLGTAVVLIICYPALQEQGATLLPHILGTVATLIAWCLCWYASAQDARFVPKATSAMGGDVEANSGGDQLPESYEGVNL
jgi:hypothetical protein